MKPQIPHGPEELICPLHKQSMEKVCHKCPWWMHVRGKDPQSEAEIDQWQCSITWIAPLLIENSQQQRQTGAAIESFRNEMAKGQTEAIQRVLSHVSSGRLPFFKPPEGN